MQSFLRCIHVTLPITVITLRSGLRGATPLLAAKADSPRLFTIPYTSAQSSFLPSRDRDVISLGAPPPPAIT